MRIKTRFKLGGHNDGGADAVDVHTTMAPIFAICALVLGLYLRNMTSSLSVLSIAQKSSINTAIRAIIVLFIVFSAGEIIKSIDGKFLMGLLIVFACILLHFLIYTKNNIYFVDTLKTFAMTIFPGVLCLRCVKDYDCLYKCLYKTSKVISVICVYNLFLLITRLASSSNYYMGLGQALLLPTNIIFLSLFDPEERKPSSLILYSINVFSIILLGARGSLVALLFFSILVILNKSVNGRISGVVFISLLLFVAVLFVFAYESILETLISVLSKYGLSSRSLSMLLSGSIKSTSGRNEIWSNIWQSFCANPFLPHGINGDITFTQRDYSHNLFLELLFTFGAPIGIAVSFLFIVKFLRSFKIKKESRSKIKTLFMVSFFPVCLFSGSLWTELYCWLWLFV